MFKQAMTCWVTAAMCLCLMRPVALADEVASAEATDTAAGSAIVSTDGSHVEAVSEETPSMQSTPEELVSVRDNSDEGILVEQQERDSAEGLAAAEGLVVTEEVGTEELATEEIGTVEATADRVIAESDSEDETELSDTGSGTNTSGGDVELPEIPLDPIKIASVAVVGSISDQTYIGVQIKPVPTVKLKSGAALRRNVDYTLAWGVNKSVGKGTVTITGKGSYTGTLTVEFTIAPRKIELVAKVAKVSARTYNGKQQKPVPTVTLKSGGAKLVRNTDYTLSWSANTNVGVGVITIKGKGNYEGTIKSTFAINPASISSVAKVATISARTYNGKQQKPVPTVTLKSGGAKLVKGTDYTLSWGSNIKVGTGTVTVKGKNNYGGSITVRFNIVEAAPPTVSYRTHVQTFGWQDYVRNGAVSGTSGQSKRLEGINVKLGSSPYTGGIQYQTHVQRIGWQGWRRDGKMAGTSRQSLRLEAIQIKLYGELAEHYNVYYRVHAQHFGWMGWAKNGARAGTAGHSYRLEAIQIVLVKKGAKAPGATYQGVTSNTTVAYKER